MPNSKNAPAPQPPDPKTKTTYFSNLLAAQKQQSKDCLRDLLRMRGLMPLLMKRRNGNAWTASERAELHAQLQALSRVSPYLLLLLLPGSMLLLPAYAFWLDNRRKPRNAVSPTRSLPDVPRAD